MPLKFLKRPSWKKPSGDATDTNVSQVSNHSAGSRSLGDSESSDAGRTGAANELENFERHDSASHLLMLPGMALDTAIEKMTSLSVAMSEQLEWKRKADPKEMAIDESQKTLKMIDGSVSLLEQWAGEIQQGTGFDSTLPKSQKLAEELGKLRKAHQDWKDAGPGL